MLELDPSIEALIEGPVTNLTLCWAVTKADDVVVRGTMHDQDIAIADAPYAGTYSARNALKAGNVEHETDGAVSNTSIEGGLFYWGSIPEFTKEDIEAGLYDQAKAVLLLVSWPAPAKVVKVVLAGTLGEFDCDDTGIFRSEVRGLTQPLSQVTTHTYAERCNVKRFGDSRCKFNVAAVTRTGSIDSVANRRRFVATLDAGVAPHDDAYYGNGLVTFTSGDNDGYTREVRAHSPVNGSQEIEIQCFEEFPADIAVNDTFSLTPGCDRLHSTCKFVYNNIANFRGYGVLAPGKAKMIRDPKTVSSGPSVEFESEAAFDARRAALSALYLEIL